MDKRRLFKITAIVLGISAMLGCVWLLSLSFRGSSSTKLSPAQYAYQACRKVMLNTEGYRVWKLKDSQYRLISATFTFSDGFNDATCTVTGLGSFWKVTRTMQTLVGCVQALTDSGGLPCPAAKYGVSP